MSDCPRCEELNATVTRLREDSEAWQAQAVANKRTETRLRNEIARNRGRDPQVQVIRELFDHWLNVCKGGRKGVLLTDDRFDAIKARLKEGYTAEQVHTAIDGAAKDAFVNEKGRRFDDLTLICRSGSKLEDFIERADKPATHPVAVPTPWEPKGAVYTASPLDRAVAALRKEFGFDRTFGADWDEKAMRYLDYWAPCPIRPAMASPMRIREQGDGWSPRGGSLFLACVHGCTHDELFDALRVVEQKQERLKAEAVSRAVAA